MRTLFLTFSIVVATAAAITPLTAQESKRGNKDLKTYCSGDAVTYCSGNDPDSSAMDACFQKNMDNISENCRRAIKAYKASGGK